MRNGIPKWKNSNDASFGDWLVFGNGFAQAATVGYSEVSLMTKSGLSVFVEGICHDISKVGLADTDIFALTI